MFANWTTGLANYILTNSSYIDIINKEFADEIKNIRYNSKIVSIEVRNITSTKKKVYLIDSHRDVYTDYDYVVVTVPVPILKEIKFSPSLSLNKLESIEKMKMEHCAKLIIKFTTKFWPDDLSWLVVNGKIPVFWPSGMCKDTKVHALTGMASGWKCAYLNELYLKNKNLFIKEILTDLGRVFKIDNIHALLVDFFWYDWGANPHIKGGYSYHYIGELEGKWREKVKQPHCDVVFFSGEAVASNWNIATVHGAFDSGIESANYILSDISKKSTKF